MENFQDIHKQEEPIHFPNFLFWDAQAAVRNNTEILFILHLIALNDNTYEAIYRD